MTSFYRKALDLKSATPFFLLALACAFLTVFLLSKETDLKGDEAAHYTRQIELFLNGDLRIAKVITTIPGYHAVVAFVMGALGLDSAAGARGVHVTLSFAVIVIFWILCRRFYPSMEEIKTLQFALCPLIFPYFFLIYTDVLAVGLILLSFFFMKSRRLALAATFGLLSFLVRQDAIIWVAFIFTYHLLPTSPAPESWRRRLVQLWPFFVVFALFLVFLVVNKGIAVHQKKYHPAFEFYSGNLYLFLFLYFFLFLPQNLFIVWRKHPALRRYSWIFAASVAACFLTYYLTFHVTHPYNAADYWDGCLRNKLLALGQESLSGRILFFIPVLVGLLGMILQSFRQPQDRLLLLFVPLALIPHWLIEVRYGMAPLAFLILFRQPENRTFEITTTIFFAAASIVLFAAIQSGKYFP